MHKYTMHNNVFDALVNKDQCLIMWAYDQTGLWAKNVTGITSGKQEFQCFSI